MEHMAFCVETFTKLSHHMNIPSYDSPFELDILIMLRQLLQVPGRHGTLSQCLRANHHKVNPRRVGISLVRTHEKDEEECPFPTIRQFNVETKERRHTFSVPCDRAVTFMKLGAINRPITIQYCHYLAEIVRTCEAPEDIDFYATKCADLLRYLLRTDKDTPPINMAKLLADVADTTKENCSMVHSYIIMDGIWRGGFTRKEFAQLLGAYYKFCLWELADKILDSAPIKLTSFRVAEPFTQGVINAGRQYKELDGRAVEKAAIRAKVIKSLAKICNAFTLTRAQMITKHNGDFIQALKDLELGVKINPTIKMSGRCTGCETHLPLFDNKLVAPLNASLRDQLHKGSEKGLYLNSSPIDVNRYEAFLQEIYAKDKKPIDLVIDGLNIAYRTSQGFNVLQLNLTPEFTKSVKIHKPESLSQVLINCIIRGDMLKHFRKILVVGKKHMTKWPGLMDFFAKHKIHYYSSFNNSKDDLFQLVAATMSPKTMLVTNDFLRDHLAQLEEPVRVNLERWIDTHQVWIGQKNLKAIWPTPYEKIAHVNPEGDVFHLPVIDFHQLDMVGVCEPPPHLSSKSLTWVCCDLRPKGGETKNKDVS